MEASAARECAVCGGLVVVLTPDSSVEYRHWTEGLDHKPEPRPIRDSSCDFCDGPNPVAVLFCNIVDVLSSERRTAAIHTPTDDGAWRTCQSCLDCIRADKWDAILVRAMANFVECPPTQFERVRETTHRLHETFRERYKGEWAPLDVETS